MKKTLKWHNIIVVSIIMLGPALIKSTELYFMTEPSNIGDNLEFSIMDNYKAIGIQSIQLLIAFLYLRLVKFDFSTWKYKVSLKNIMIAVVVFLLLGLLMDIAMLPTYGIDWVIDWIQTNNPISIFGNIDASLIIFSLLNGFYEEIFFLGICTAVQDKYQKIFWIYAVGLRIAVHTYQGIWSAMSLGIILGVTYHLLYRKKSNNLFIYTTSHAFADIFGLSLLHFL
ncbi:CAAX protease self-immunity [Granulicatella balaenopterae]|uniref:CAAX protease self-immunity n=1 Tax=Granulicatella balaenopterae TaxID=137733 RepID=A0A1H9PNT6_9LACT|nr:CPBP family glutamic-type intramembrane protease [Granulicatella balaenopterae]SER49838.1 CAAX protease self-immunity [Granulicatella balaenopterae]